MKISLNQLKQYIDINVSVEELCERLVSAGFEIEEIEDLSLGVRNVKVGRIEKIVPHPDSDHMLVCTVDVGTGSPLQIVTGAGNIFEGAFVPVAMHDSFLPDGTHIKKGKLRGVESVGMLCSGAELALHDCDYPGAEVNGILILDDEYLVGTDMREVLGLYDYVIDVKITANRPDCNCILGVAKEAATVLGVEFHPPKTDYKSVGGDINDYIKIDVENYDLCPRYVGRFVKNLKIGRSPKWLRRCLSASGMRPINNIVDITNFVMLETGQPMHAFNYDELEGKHIIVRTAREGECITTLDGKAYSLTPEMLVIADGEKPSCLAGIMGGIESEITDTTKNLFLESAKFRRDNIRRTGRALGIRTEASGRFERGVDANNTSYAMDRALSLICELGAGEVIDGVIDKNESLPAERVLTVKCSDVCALLGIEVPKSEIVAILKKLSLSPTLSGDELTCRVPSIRSDIEGVADIAEEVMRIYGCDKITGKPMRGEVRRGRKIPSRLCEDRVRGVMTSAGAYEILTYSFIGSRAAASLSLKEGDERLSTVPILNPLGDEYSVLRTQLTTGMLSVLATNHSRKIPSARFFELGTRFMAESLPLKAQPKELPTLSIGVYGDGEDFFTLKGMLERLFEEFGAAVTYERSSEPYLHPGRQAAAKLDGEIIATFGEIHPEAAARFSVAPRSLLAEVKCERLFALEKPKTVYKPLPRFPAVTRDYALLCDIDLPASQIAETIRRAAGKLCESVDLFDVYVGSQIPEGKKSIAYSATLRSRDGTLTDERVEQVSEKIVAALSKIGAELRK